ncbi:MAG: hypothetical protein KAT62_05375 [Desulfuromonadales bacterium]|nr:hypothetical protein [Desulfuromonadales bacterium]
MFLRLLMTGAGKPLAMTNTSKKNTKTAFDHFSKSHKDNARNFVRKYIKIVKALGCSHKRFPVFKL